MEPTKRQDRKSRRSVFAVGIVLAICLIMAFTVGPIVASKFFPDDGTGSPGNPTRTNPAQRN